MKNATLSKVFALLLVALFSVNFTRAAVTITQPTGGLDISANKSPGGKAAGFTAIGDIVITDQLSSDFTPNLANRTIVFTRPTNWAFNAGVGAVTFTGPTITAASVVITTTTITVTFSTGAVIGTGNSITIKDIAIQSTLNRALAPIAFRKTGGTAAIAGLPNNTTIASFSQVAGDLEKLLLLVPGETYVAGTVNGKTGTPTNRIAGAAFNVSVRAVDEFCNVVAVNHSVGLSSTDVDATLNSGNLVNGIKTNFSVTFRTEDTQTITATDITDGLITASTSANFSVVPGPFIRLQVLLPGETSAPGTPTGKTGTPIAQTAGVPFNVIVNAVNVNWNVVPIAPEDEISITSTDLNASLPANANLSSGTQTFSVILKTAGNRRITATDITDGTKTASTSPNVSVVANDLARLLVLMPGEVIASGSPTGKTGTPTAVDSGTPFNITVRSTDDYFNPVSSNHSVKITSTDVDATLVSSIALVNGARFISTTLRTSGLQSVTAEDLTDPLIESNQGSDVMVNSGPFVKLQILLPGETAAPGTPTGKIGTPNDQVAGIPFNVTVNAVNANWEIITTAPADEIAITSSDLNAVLPANANLSSGTVLLSVTLKTGGNRTVTASNISDAGKTANTSPNVTVSANSLNRLLVLMPGETAAPGTATGKTGTPTAISSGTPFNITVRSTDAYWNLVSSTHSVKITSTDPAATVTSAIALAGGSRSISTTLRTAGLQSVTAEDLTDPVILNNQGSDVTVSSGGFTKLQILLPGETAAPGTPTGKTGTPTAQIAGNAFTVTVNAVNANWEIISGAPSDQIKITSSDLNAILPVNANLASGTQTFLVTLKTGGSRTITATNVSDGTKTANTSSNVTIGANTIQKLLVLMPGESQAPGTLTGKTGVASNRVAGTNFNITVRSVDAYWNTVSSTASVKITSSDPSATVVASINLVAGTRNIPTTLRTLGSQTVTAEDLAATLTSNTGSSVIVESGPYVRLQILLPGETAAPGTVSGKTGTPTPQTAGSAFQVTVNAVNANWEIVSSAPSHEIEITSSDVNAALPPNASFSGGTRTFWVTLKTAGNRTITARNLTDGSKTENTSPNVAVVAGTYSKLMILLPGQTAAPGYPTGKNGNAIIPTRGTPFTINVRAVDDNFNLVSSIANTISITSLDGTATLPPNAALVGGARNFTINLRASGSQYVMAKDLSTSFDELIEVPDATGSSTATDYFRSVRTGNFNVTTTWETSPDNATWIPATLFPTIASAGITISLSHIVTVTANATVDDFIVLNGGQLNINTGVTLTIADGAAAEDFSLAGTLENSGVVATTGAMVVKATGIYNHAFTTTQGTIPTATWIDGSACIIGGYTSAAGNIGGFDQSFYNLTWNCPDQNVMEGPVLRVLSGATVRNNFSVFNTGSGSLRINTAAGPLNIKNYIQSGGKVNTNGANPAINISGNFDMSNGSIGTGPGSSIAGLIFNGSAPQNFIKTDGSINGAIDDDIILNNLTVNNSGGVNLMAGELTINGTLAIPTGSLNMGTSALTAVNTNSGTGTLITQNTSVLPIPSSKTWSIGITYNSPAAQTIVAGDYTDLNGTGGMRTLPSTLNIAGTFTPGSPANYNTAGNTINFNGAGIQNIPAFAFNNLTISNSGTKTVIGDATVLNTLSVEDAAILNANGKVTLLASASKNANIDALLGSADIIGDVNIQSYLYGEPSGRKRGTKSMSSPIRDASIPGAKTFEQLKNYVIITGPGGTSNGFDAGPGPSPTFNPVTLNFFNEPASPSASAFIPVPSIGTNTSPGTGFLMFFRGDRSGIYSNPGKLLAPFSAAEDVLVTYTGPINKGDISLNIGYTNHGDAYDGLYLAGNPYPATIDWHAVRNESSDLNATITVVTGGKANATYNAVAQVSANGGSRYIQPGQGFYIQAADGGGILRFKESQKDLTHAPARLLSIPDQPRLQVKLDASPSNKTMSSPTVQQANPNRKTLRMKLLSGGLEEEAVVLFDNQFSAVANEDDSKYLSGFDVSLATLSSDNQPLAINLMPAIEGKQELKLNVNALVGGSMSLEFTAMDLGNENEAWLEDTFLGSLTPVFVGSSYSFEIDKRNANTFGDKRFKLLLNPPGTLTVKLADFDAKKNENGVDLTWHTVSESNNLGFEIQRAGGTNEDFSKIAFVEAAVNPSNWNSYTFRDISPLQGGNYYRLKQIDKDGQSVFSIEKYIDFDLHSSKIAFKVYPNPTSGRISISSPGYQGIMKMAIIGLNGKRMLEVLFNSGEALTHDISTLPNGMYLLELRKADGSILGTNKLIKH